MSSRRSEEASCCRNVSYERFCTSMRFGISTIDGILPKSLRLRRPHWITPAICSPGGRSRRPRRVRRHAPLLLEQLGELGGLEQCQLVELFGDLLNRGHRSVSFDYSAAFLPRCCRTYTSSRCGAVSTPTSCARIPWIAPINWAR